MKRLTIYDEDESQILLDCLAREKSRLKKKISVMDEGLEKWFGIQEDHLEEARKEAQMRLNCLCGMLLRAEDLLDRFVGTLE